MRWLKDRKGISPVVAALILIVVAVVGAIGVGAIMGTMTKDTQQAVNTGEMKKQSQMELLIGGSTTVQPVSELLAEAFMEEHPSVKVVVQGGGSGAGVAGVGMGILDIGASSSWDKVESGLQQYPDLKYWEIGGSGVVVIAGKNFSNWGALNITKEALRMIYNDTDGRVWINVTNVSTNRIITAADVNQTGAGTSGTWVEITAYQRQEESGTEETFAKWLFGVKQLDDVPSVAEGEVGNAGVLAAVQNNQDSIGFVDFGYASKDGKANEVCILGIDADGDGKIGTPPGVAPGNSTAEWSSFIKSALKGEKNYPEDDTGKLSRNLYYLTKGEPDPIEKAFIDFALSPGAEEYFHEVGYFHVLDYKSVH